MRTFAIIAAASFWVSGCTTPAMHEVTEYREGEAYWCIGPDGNLVREQFGNDGKVTCPAPGRIVSMPLCTSIQPPPSDELAYLRARGRAARDGSLHGDSFEGHSFCAPPKLGPPRPTL